LARPGQLALALLMLGVLADDTHHTTAVNDLALVTNLLYGCSDLHSNSLKQPVLLASGLRPEAHGTVLYCFGSS
jgi:hypothetical protein